MRNRITSKTPRFFRILRTVGVAVAAAGTAIVTLPIALPVAVVTIGGYLIAAGSVAAAVSQATKENE